MAREERKVGEGDEGGDGKRKREGWTVRNDEYEERKDAEIWGG